MARCLCPSRCAIREVAAVCNDTYRLKDLLDGLQTVKDQLEMMGYPYPVSADFKVTITNRKGEPKFSVSMPTVRV